MGLHCSMDEGLREELDGSSARTSFSRVSLRIPSTSSRAFTDFFTHLLALKQYSRARSRGSQRSPRVGSLPRSSLSSTRVLSSRSDADHFFSTFLLFLLQLGGLYETYSSANSTSTTIKRDNATSKADLHYQQGALLKDAILDLFWDPAKLAFYDFVSLRRFPFLLPLYCYSKLTPQRSSRTQLRPLEPTSSPSPLSTPSVSVGKSSTSPDSALIPSSSSTGLGIIPEEVENDEQKLFQAFSGLNLMLEKYNGSVPCTLTESNLNWDFREFFGALFPTFIEVSADLNPRSILVASQPTRESPSCPCFVARSLH